MKFFKFLFILQIFLLSVSSFALEFIPHEILKNDVVHILKTDLLNQCTGFETEVFEVTKFSSEIVDDLDPGYSDETIEIELSSKISSRRIETMIVREIQNPSNRLMTYKVFIKAFENNNLFCSLNY